MKLAIYVFLLISCSAVLYFTGDTNILTALSDPNSQYHQLVDANGNLTNTGLYTLVFGSILAAGGAIALSQLMGFGAIYVVALLLVFGFLNIFIFPLSVVLDATTPAEIKAVIVLFFNGLLALTIYGEGRGR